MASASGISPQVEIHEIKLISSCHRFIGPLGGQDFDRKAVVFDLLVMLQRVDRIVGGADDFYG